MAQYVHPEVAAARDDPTPGSTLQLILILDDGATEEVTARVKETEASIENVFETDMILVDAPETEVGTLCEIPGVSSVSPDGEIETLA